MPRPVLAVHVVFHPESADARALAGAIDLALNGRDPVTGDRSDETPHIAIPTYFLPEPRERGGLPPTPPAGTPRSEWGDDLWFAERNLIVALSDEYLAAPPIEHQDSPDPDWADWVWEFAGRPARHPRRRKGQATRLLPVMLTNEGWPLHHELQTTSFVRLLGEPGSADRIRRLVRRVVQELCRYLRDDAPAPGDAPAPVDLFISHAKADLQRAPRVLAALLSVLGADQPVRAWVDSGNIEPGGDFAARIRDALSDHTLICVLTDHYSGRPWCRTEARVAKQLGRPMVVIDALQTQDLRLSPFLGNVPTLRWTPEEGDEPARREFASRAVDLALLETLRRTHAGLELRQLRKSTPGRLNTASVLTAPPEPLTMLKVRPGPVLHPDPPLPADERALYEGKWRLSTPSTVVAGSPGSLRGLLVGLSTSESSDSHRHGLTRRSQADAYIDLARALLLSDARVGYGGQFGGKLAPEISLFDMALAYRREGTTALLPVESWIAWPQRVELKVTARYKGVVEFHRLPRPSDPTLARLDPSGLQYPPADADEYHAWAWGLTTLRRAMADACDARILIGGKLTGTGDLPWYSGRLPGVLEEAWLTIQAGETARTAGRLSKPLYVIGAWGGAAHLVGELLRGRTPPEALWTHHLQSPMAEVLHSRLNPGGPSLWKQVVEELQTAGIAGCANGLTEEENDELFECRYVARIVELVVTGLVRWRAGG